MIINIQVNFTTGIGDFYTYFCEAYFFCKQLKSLGYNTHLYLYTRNTIDFWNLFDKEAHQYFDEVTLINVPKTSEDFDGYQIIYPSVEHAPGVHCWEAFAPQNFNAEYVVYQINLGRPHNLNYTHLNDFPKLSQNVIEKTNNFRVDNQLNNFSVVHFRDRDDSGDRFNNQLLNQQYQSYSIDTNSFANIEKICKENEKVFVCSNNVAIKKYLQSLHNNIVISDDNILKTTNRSYCDEEYWYFCLTEFCLMSMPTQIYLFNNYSWITNFISYGLFHNKYSIINPYNTNPFVKNFGGFVFS